MGDRGSAVAAVRLPNIPVLASRSGEGGAPGGDARHGRLPLGVGADPAGVRRGVREVQQEGARVLGLRDARDHVATYTLAAAGRPILRVCRPSFCRVPRVCALTIPLVLLSQPQPRMRCTHPHTWHPAYGGPAAARCACQGADARRGAAAGGRVSLALGSWVCARQQLRHFLFPPRLLHGF